MVVNKVFYCFQLIKGKIGLIRLLIKRGLNVNPGNGRINEIMYQVPSNTENKE